MPFRSASDHWTNDSGPRHKHKQYLWDQAVIEHVLSVVASV